MTKEVKALLDTLPAEFSEYLTEHFGDSLLVADHIVDVYGFNDSMPAAYISTEINMAAMKVNLFYVLDDEYFKGKRIVATHAHFSATGAFLCTLYDSPVKATLSNSIHLIKCVPADADAFCMTLAHAKNGKPAEYFVEGCNYNDEDGRLHSLVGPARVVYDDKVAWDDNDKWCINGKDVTDLVFMHCANPYKITDDEIITIKMVM